MNLAYEKEMEFSTAVAAFRELHAGSTIFIAQVNKTGHNIYPERDNLLKG